MKRFLLFVILILSMEQLNAQNTSRWVGVSNSPDPMIRRQEAFMDAFCQYVLSNKVAVSGIFTENGEKTTTDSRNSCRFHILSDVTDEKGETLTIAIGCGTLIDYVFTSSSERTDDEMRIETVLTVLYREDSEGNRIRSIHEYRSLDSTHKKEFAYKCENIEPYE